VVKLVADRSARVLVGATVVSPRAGEMLGELTLAIRARIPLGVLDDTLQAFPTFSRVLQGLFAELR
jgi:dihydrolipoamide dehydrogenase